MSNESKKKNDVREIDCPQTVKMFYVGTELDLKRTVAEFSKLAVNIDTVRRADSDKIGVLLNSIFQDAGATHMLMPSIKQHLSTRLSEGKVLVGEAAKDLEARIAANLPRLVFASKGKGGTRLSTNAERAYFDLNGKQSEEPIADPTSEPVVAQA